MAVTERDPYSEHVKNVKALAAAGISPPAEWTKVQLRLTDYLRLRTPARERLIDALIEGVGDVAALRAQAFAEATVVPAVNHAIVAGVHRKLLDLYSGHARKNYQRLADQFNAAAKEFADAVAIVDPERDAATMVDAPEDQRQAWLAAPLVSARLDGLIGALRAAAELAGVSTAPEMQLAMVLRPGSAHRRRTWEAWGADGRTGRWAAVIAAGAQIHADALDRVSPYRRPRPIERRVEERGGMLFDVPFDPEDIERPAMAVA